MPVVAPDGCDVSVSLEHGTKTSTASAGGSSGLGDRRGNLAWKSWLWCDEDELGGKMYRLGKKERWGVDEKSPFTMGTSGQGNRWMVRHQRRATGGGRKVWNIANLAPASPSGGTTHGRVDTLEELPPGHRVGHIRGLRLAGTTGQHATDYGHGCRR